MVAGLAEITVFGDEIKLPRCVGTLLALIPVPDCVAFTVLIGRSVDR